MGMRVHAYVETEQRFDFFAAFFRQFFKQSQFAEIVDNHRADAETQGVFKFGAALVVAVEIHFGHIKAHPLGDVQFAAAHDVETQPLFFNKPYHRVTGKRL